MKPLIVMSPPFSGKPPQTNEKPTWIRPQLVAEVKFAEWTRDGLMRQPVFLGMRDDVDPKNVRRERPRDADRESARAEATSTAPSRVAARTAVLNRPGKPAMLERLATSPGADRTPATSPSEDRKPATTSARRRKAAALPAEIPDSPLSRAAARITSELGTNIRGATAAELEALDAIKKEGNWEIGGRVVHLTNLEKLLFPEDKYSKRDLIRYYVQVAPVLIPYFSQRPLSMNPHPDGIHGNSFWQKDKPDYAPEWIPTFRFQDRKNIKDWILIEEVATLAWLANHAVLDMHPWYSRRDTPEYPDWSAVDPDA